MSPGQSIGVSANLVRAGNAGLSHHKRGHRVTMARLSDQRHGVTVCNGAAVSDVVKRERRCCGGREPAPDSQQVHRREGVLTDAQLPRGLDAGARTSPRRGALRRDGTRPIAPKHRYGGVAIVEIASPGIPETAITIFELVVRAIAVVVTPAAAIAVAIVAGGEDVRDPHTSPFCSFPGTSRPRKTSPSQPPLQRCLVRSVGELRTVSHRSA